MKTIMKLKIIIYGLGNIYEKYREYLYRRFDVVGVTSSNDEEGTKHANHISRKEIVSIDYDYVLICIRSQNAILNKLIDDLKESEKAEPETEPEPVSEPVQYENIQPLWRADEIQSQSITPDEEEEKQGTKKNGIRKTIISFLVCVVIAVTAAILIS